MSTKVSRLTKAKELFSPDHFYIYQCDNGVWHFRDTINHMVICNSDSLEGLGDRIKSILIRYNNYDRYKKIRDNMSETGVTPKALLVREKEYKSKGSKYSTYLDELISEHNNGLQERVNKTRVRKIVPINIEDSPKAALPQKKEETVVCIKRHKGVPRRKSRL